MQIDAKLGSRSAQIKLLEAIKELLYHFRFLISSCLLKWRTAFLRSQQQQQFTKLALHVVQEWKNRQKKVCVYIL